MFRFSAILLLVSTALFVTKVVSGDEAWDFRKGGTNPLREKSPRVLGVNEGSEAVGGDGVRYEVETFENTLSRLPMGSVVSQGLTQIHTAVRQIVDAEVDVMERVLGRLQGLSSVVTQLTDSLFPPPSTGPPPAVAPESFNEEAVDAASSVAHAGESTDDFSVGESPDFESLRTQVGQFSRTAAEVFEKAGYEDCGGRHEDRCEFEVGVLEDTHFVFSLLKSAPVVDEAFVAVSDVLRSIDGGFVTTEDDSAVYPVLESFQRLGHALQKINAIFDRSGRALEEISVSDAVSKDSVDSGVAPSNDAEANLAGLLRGAIDVASILSFLRRFATTVINGGQIAGPNEVANGIATEEGLSASDAERLNRFMNTLVGGPLTLKNVSSYDEDTKQNVRGFSGRSDEAEDIAARGPEIFVQTYLQIKKALVDIILPPVTTQEPSSSPSAPGTTPAPASTASAGTTSAAVVTTASEP